VVGLAAQTLVSAITAASTSRDTVIVVLTQVVAIRVTTPSDVPAATVASKLQDAYCGSVHAPRCSVSVSTSRRRRVDTAASYSLVRVVEGAERLDPPSVDSNQLAVSLGTTESALALSSELSSVNADVTITREGGETTGSDLVDMSAALGASVASELSIPASDITSSSPQLLAPPSMPPSGSAAESGGGSVGIIIGVVVALLVIVGIAFLLRDRVRLGKRRRLSSLARLTGSEHLKADNTDSTQLNPKEKDMRPSLEPSTSRLGTLQKASSALVSQYAQI